MQAQSGPTAIFLTLVVVIFLMAGLFLYERHNKEKIKKQIAAYREEEARNAALAAAMPEAEPEPAAPATTGSVKLDKLIDADPGFSAVEFLGIARETFLLINEAKFRGAPVIARDLMVPELEATLTEEPIPMPSLELEGATIDHFQVDNGQTTLSVHFDVIGYEVAPGQQPDLAEPKRWSEEWEFVRAADAKTAPDDPGSLQPGWMVSHKGWRVSSINPAAQPD